MKKLIIVLALAVTAITAWAQVFGNRSMTPEQKIRMAEAIIENFYVDSINAEQVVEEGIRGMLSALDPHSSYSTAKETEELNTPLQGKFSGVGIQFNLLHDSLYVVQTTVGGPAEKVGMLPGDRILSANDSVMSGVKRTNADVQRLLRGPKGTKCAIKVKRGKEIIDFLVIRDDIPIHSVDAAYMAAPGVGYVRVSRFAEETADEVAEALDKLRRQGMTSIIIDLEDNGGGYLGTAYDLASMFLDRDNLVVYTEGLNAAPQIYETSRRGQYVDYPLVVMVNQYSASASEIFAGAMQDNDRGVVVGRRTFGKGLVQRPFPFADGSMIRLTTAHYYTPTGRSIQKPYTKGDRDAYNTDILDRFNAGELMHEDSVKLDRSKVYYTIRNNRPVYGGGGIMPDVFVPLDTTMNTKYYRDLTAKGVFNQFVASYLDKHRTALKKAYPTEDDFYNKFKVTPELTRELVEFGQKEGVDIVPDQLETSRVLIDTVIKGLLERDLYDEGSYMRVSNALDDIYKRALQIITDPKEYYKLLGDKVARR